MRTKFGKGLVASGLIAALGVNVMAAGTAYADPGRDRGRERGYGRDDYRGYDKSRGRGQDRHHASKDSHNRNAPGRRYGGHGNDGHRNGGRADGRHDDRGGNRYHAQHHRGHAPVRIVRKPVVIHKKVVRTAPAVKHYTHGRYGPPPTRVVVVPERRHYRNVRVVRDYGHRYHGYGRYHHDDDAYKWLAFTAITVAIINNLTVYQQRAYEDAQIRATTAPIGETIRWNEGGAYGTVTTTRDGTSSLNRYCREFQKTVTIGGRTERAYGTACMQPDGAWEVVSNSNGY